MIKPYPQTAQYFWSNFFDRAPILSVLGMSKLRPIRSSLRTFSSAPKSEASQFWPPGPPAFHKDPAITAEADKLYNAVLKNYQLLGRKKRTDWNDPWAKREDWRYHPYFSGINVIKHAFPGLSWGLAAFLAYCGYEAYFT